jgi:hypothetical protein
LIELWQYRCPIFEDGPKFFDTICRESPSAKVSFSSYQLVDITDFPLDLDSQILARATPGFSGADLANMIK